MSATAFPIALRRRVAATVPAAALAAAVLVALIVGLQLWAIQVAYPLRVTSDVPTYLALLRAMAAHPLAKQSLFLAAPGISTPHSTPYMLALALLWHAVAPPGHATDPLAAGRFLGLIGIPVSLATLGLIAWFGSRIAGRRAGLVAIAVLLVLFGPANVIWAGDLTINGLLYAGFYPENVALAVALGALLALRRRGWPSLVLASILSGWAMIESPLTGTLLAALATADGCLRAWRGEDGVYRSSAALSFGFIAGLAWPAYPLNQAMEQSGVPGSVVIAACALAPRAVAMLAPLLRCSMARLERRGQALAAALTGRRALAGLTIAGAVIVAGLALWEVLLILRGSTDPLIRSNHLAAYWGEDRWRWFLMLGAGAVGVCGLVRLARAGKPLLLIWFAGCSGIAVLGLLGLPVPVWWRFLLLCQVPLAIGTAVVLVEAGPLRWLLGATLGFALAFKLATLLVLPTTVTYFGSPLQEAYQLGQLIPAQSPGLVASDPFTSYYIPGTTGRQVLTVTKGHVGSQAELTASTHGYALLHDFYVAPDNHWWPAAQAIWSSDVRYFLVEKQTSLAPANLELFSTGPTPLIRTATDAAMMGRLFWRLGRIGSLLYSDPQYALYRLDGTKLFPAPVPAPAPAPSSHRSPHGRRRS